MRIKPLHFACAFVAAWATPYLNAQTVYKCTIGGKAIYQDTPCPTERSTLRTITVDSAPITTAPDVDAKRQADKDRIALRIKRNDIERDLSHAERRRQNIKSEFERKSAALDARAATANNNLAGATYRQSIAAEKQALSTGYQADLQAVNGEIDRLTKELRALK